MNNKKKSFSDRLLDRVFYMIRFKERNTYEGFRKMKNVSVPPSYFFINATITYRDTASIKLISVLPNAKATGKHILYLHGGAYVSGFSMGHWYFLSELYKKTACHILAPDYPLAPDTTASELLPMMLKLYRDVIKGINREDLIVMGDSAGAGLALALCQQLTEEEQPAELVLLSPWLDLSMENPEIKKVDKLDPILNIQGLKDSAAAYAGGLDLKDPRLSPLFGKMETLAPISMYAGTHDILFPDASKLPELLHSIEKKINYVKIDKMLHCGMLYPTEEGKLCRDIIIEALRK